MSAPIEPVHQKASSTVSEFCVRYQINKATFYRNRKRGLMPRPIKVGSATRILLQDEMEWLAQQRTAAMSPEASQ